MSPTGPRSRRCFTGQRAFVMTPPDVLQQIHRVGVVEAGELPQRHRGWPQRRGRLVVLDRLVRDAGGRLDLEDRQAAPDAQSLDQGNRATSIEHALIPTASTPRMQPLTVGLSERQPANSGPIAGNYGLYTDPMCNYLGHSGAKTAHRRYPRSTWTPRWRESRSPCQPSTLIYRRRTSCSGVSEPPGYCAT